ncbi:MAG: FAD-dependent oxidoreductase [Anaerolineae bacterium]|nr:FAD-dependent oxidoreductase [Anaerolineae bacterium]
MRKEACDVVVVGSGPAGLAAASAAQASGASTTIVERSREMGGVLLQCIHPGFGLKLYGEELTGPEYAYRWLDQLDGVRCLTEAMVVQARRGTDDHPDEGFTLWVSGPAVGLVRIRARAVVLAMGCRERTRGAIAIPGTRPAGVMTAGTAQRLVNIDGYLPGKRFAILGSGDIGMIMARRLTWEGAEVVGVYELMPYLSGLRRNYVQCLQDYDVPLYLGHTVTEIHGDRRLTGVTVCQVDEALCPRPETGVLVPADTLLLSVGLIPENELTRMLGAELDPVTGGPLVDDGMQTTVPGLFAAGNVVQVHDLADDVTMAGELAGREAARYVLEGPEPRSWSRVVAGRGVRSVVPQRLRLPVRSRPELAIRVRRPIEATCRVTVSANGETLIRKRLDYARPGEMIGVRLSPRAARALRPEDDVLVEVSEG